MSIAIVFPNWDAGGWIKALHAVDPTLDVEVWPEISDPDAVEFALCWNQPTGVLRQFSNLRCVSSLGAGVEHLISDATLPAGVPVVRLVDHNLKQSMAEYVTLGVLEHFRRFEDYRRQQDQGIWKPLKIPHISSLGIGIMGFGEIGRYVGRRLSDLGFTVHGWTRRQKQVDGFKIYSGREGLDDFLEKSNILVCMLPLTPETENILSARTFSHLPENAYLINVGRGAHLVDDDLLAALDSGQLSGALLDVFREEPLPKGHPFWLHKKITVTPHIASVTNPRSASVQIVENYRRVLENRPLLNVVDVQRGY